MLSPDQVQKVVDAENERLNKINMEKAGAYVRELAAVTAQRDRLNETIAEIQGKIANLQFDSVTAADVVGSNAGE